jgi:signal transduction histidine kinase
MRGIVNGALAGRGWPATDARVVLPDGSVRWLRSAGANHDEGGRRKVNVIMHDVTALKLAERELLANLERERELSQLRADFMNMVTHEYRTPLGIIMSSVQILERYFERLSSEERASHLTEIRRGAGRLAELVEEVLFLGKAEAGHIPLELRPFDLAAVLEKLTAEVTTALGADRVIHLCIDRAARRALLDLRLITHIFTNLLGNALKYSTLDTEVNVAVRRDGDDLLLEIEDHGIGIPAADQRRLFQVFQRASNVGAISGSGLGLAIVKRCIDVHGGTIALESEVGQGTRVTVRLPQKSRGSNSKSLPA